MSDTGITFGRLFRTYRDNRKWSRRQAAEQIGCHMSLINLWERGKTYPGPQYIPQVAEFIRFSERDLVWLIYKEQRRRGKYVRNV